MVVGKEVKPMTTLTESEQWVKKRWQAWGHVWALYTSCSTCGEVRHCRGKFRDRMRCLECFDQDA